MTTQTIKWLPSSSPNVVAYQVLFSDTGIDGDYAVLTLILNQIPGPNYDSINANFYYNDTEISYRYYRLRVLDSYGNVAEDTIPTPFQAGNDPVKAPTLYYIPITENTGGVNNLLYITQGGTPVDSATVRVYKKIDWDVGQTTKVIGTTITTAGGGFMLPIMVEAGNTYTVVFYKPNSYGPDKAEVTV